MTFRCGHPNTAENTYVFRRGHLSKNYCRTCHREFERRRRAAHPPKRPRTPAEHHAWMLSQPFVCGHPLGDNVKVYVHAGKPCRKCITCSRLQAQLYYEKCTKRRNGPARSPRNDREDSPLDRVLAASGRCGCGLLLPCLACVPPLYHFATARRAA